MMQQTTDRETSPPAMVTVHDRAALLTETRHALRAGQGFALATMNLDHVVKLRRDAGFRAAYAAHSHITADGRPIVWLNRLAGREVDLVTGSDLVDPLAALAAETGRPVAMVGSTEATLATAAARLAEAHPGFSAPIQIAPAMGFDPEGAEADAIIAALSETDVGLCLLALGAPKQEIFAARATRALPGIGFVSVGAGLDFIAGQQTRAPKLVRRFAGEWLWRLLGNPRRLARRYAECLWILPGLARAALSARSPRTSRRDQEPI